MPNARSPGTPGAHSAPSLSTMHTVLPAIGLPIMPLIAGVEGSVSVAVGVSLWP